jgi:hypothetical protein
MSKILRFPAILHLVQDAGWIVFPEHTSPQPDDIQAAHQVSGMHDHQWHNNLKNMRNKK